MGAGSNGTIGLLLPAPSGFFWEREAGKLGSGGIGNIFRNGYGGLGCLGWRGA